MASAPWYWFSRGTITLTTYERLIVSWPDILSSEEQLAEFLISLDYHERKRLISVLWTHLPRSSMESLYKRMEKTRTG